VAALATGDRAALHTVAAQGRFHGQAPSVALVVTAAQTQRKHLALTAGYATHGHGLRL